MAYNPSAFETVYGFALLDELHNFFPELLYDAQLFGAETVRWMRYRINTLFPQAYTRHNHLYQIYSAHSRTQDYARWHHDDTGVGDTPPPLSRVTNTSMNDRLRSPPPAPPAPHSPRVEETAQPAVLLPERTGARSRRISRGVDPPTIRTTPTLFSSIFLDFPLQDPIANDMPVPNLLNLFNLAFQDVTVAPTEAEINRVSTLRNNDDVPDEIVCSICQEHGSEHPWRTLTCSHMYHRPCIDRWLSSHTQCPICRADIRTLAAEGFQT